MGQEFGRIIHNQDLDDYRRVGFSDIQVSSIKELFRNKCNGSTEMDLKAFAKLMYISDIDAKPIFDFIDMDQNGSVGEYEFICGLALFTRTSVEERIVGIFNLYDVDRSELLSPAEFKRLIKVILDAGQPGYTPSDSEVNEKFKELSQDYNLTDDHAALVDFKKMVKEDEDFAKALKNLGIFSSNEIEDKGFDQDLHNEISKFEGKNHARFAKIKKGIDDIITKDGGMFSTENVQSGDQFMAVKPWLGTVKKSVPSSYKPSKLDSAAPDALLKLEYVHGYRCHDTRNNLRYTPDGKIVYHTAAVGIVLDQKSNTQQFMLEHQDDIMCMDTFNNLVVTGEIGDKPVLCLWDCVTMEPIATLVGVLRKGISNVCFSHDGKRLAAISMDSDHTLAMFDVDLLIEYKGVSSKKEGSALIMTGRGPSDDILDMRFSKCGEGIMAGSKTNLYFIKDGSKGGWRSNKGTGWKNGAQPSICIGFNGADSITGSSKGQIFVWRGRSISKTLQHGTKGMIYAINERPSNKGFLTGSSDGTIVVWNTKLAQERTITINSAGYNSIVPKLRSICEDSKGNILAGTRASEIIEFDSSGGRKLLNIGHYDFELWGLVMIPESDQYITCGEDFMLAKWDITERRLIKKVELKFQAKVVHVSDLKEFVAVGCTNGWVIIFNLNLEELYTIKDRKKEISDVKFSPNGEYLAVGGHDSRIYIYEVKKNWRQKGILRGHHSTITHMDWSKDSSVLQSNCTSYEILFWTINNCKQNTSGGSAYRDESWKTWNCTIGWPVQGIWPPCSNGTDINSVDRNDDMTILATGDDFGNVKLFKYPCPVEKSSYQRFSGHSSHVTNVNFSSFANYLISTGGNDKAVFQWKFVVEEEEKVKYDSEGFESSDFDYEKTERTVSTKLSEEKQERISQMGIFALQEVEGDQMGAAKPFLGEVRNSVPTGFKPHPRGNEPPNAKLSLYYIHGYRCFDTRNGAKFLESDNEIGFISAALGVKMKIEEKDQEFFNEHDEDLTSFDIHPELSIAATGQMAAKGRSKMLDIFVWDVHTKEKLATLTGFHRGAIKLLRFSTDGTKLLSFGRDDHNSLALYDWKNERLIGTSKVDQDIVLECSWDLNGTNSFVSVGMKHIKMWTVAGSTISSGRGKWGSEKAEPLCSVINLGVTSYTGSGKGNIYVWSGTSKGKPIAAHNGPVFTMARFKSGSGDQILSGGKDGKVIIWEPSKGSLTKKSNIIDFSSISSFDAGIKVIDIHKDGQKLLIGTSGSELYICDWEGNHNCIMKGHYDGELWGLSADANSDFYVTCGGDNTVRTWSVLQRTMLNHYQHKDDMRAVDWSPQGDLIVAASVKGEILLFDKELQLLSKLQSSFTKKDQWIQDIKFNPTGDLVAFGAHGGVSPLELMTVIGGKLSNKCKINVRITSALTHLDWSEDGNSILINSQAYELKYVDINGKDLIRSSSARDIKWATFTSVLGFPVQGIFPGVDGTDVNTVCRSKNQEILATGDDFQKVNLFRYPSTQPKSGCLKYTAHASHVTGVKFMVNDNVLVSTGGNDKTNIVWLTDFGGDHELKEAIFAADQGVEREDDLGLVQRKVAKNKYSGEVKGSKISENDIYTQIGAGSDVMGSSIIGGGGFAGGFQGFMAEEVAEGDEFMAVKPWKGAIKEPTDYRPPKAYDQPPNENLELEYVHGYRCKDSRNNIFYVDGGEKLAYHAAAVGIIHNVAENTQQLRVEHIDDIISMSAHPDKMHFATGEIGPKPHIFIWNGVENTTVCKIRGGVQKGVDNLGFSGDGKHLVATCMDDDHKVALFNTSNLESPVLVFVEKGGRETITGVAWTSDTTFVTFGIKHFKTWQVSPGSKPSGRSNLKLLCGLSINGAVVCGDFDGNLVVNGNVTVKALHKKCIDSITATKTTLLTGGRDNMIKVLNPQGFSVIATIDIYEILKTPLSGKVRAIAVDEATGKMAVGLYCGEIHEITYKKFTPENLTSAILSKQNRIVVQSHFAKNAKWTNEVWGLAALKDNDHYFTASDDGTFRMWSSSKRRMVKILRLDIDVNGRVLPPDKTTGDLQDQAKLRSIDISPDGKLAAVGCKDGTFRLIDLENWKQLSIIKNRKRWIEDLKFSPDGSMLAVGSHDAKIDIYSVPAFRKLQTLSKHSAFITHIDWALDSTFIHSNCGAYELLFFNAITGDQITRGATALRDEEWHTWTCTLGWPVQGIFRGTMDGSDVNKVDRSNSDHGGYKLLAASDDFGKVNLYRFPCLDKTSGVKVGNGHSSHVTNCKFSQNDTYLYTTGGEDQCVFQWKIRE